MDWTYEQRLQVIRHLTVLASDVLDDHQFQKTHSYLVRIHHAAVGQTEFLQAHEADFAEAIARMEEVG